MATSGLIYNLFCALRTCNNPIIGVYFFATSPSVRTLYSIANFQNYFLNRQHFLSLESIRNSIKNFINPKQSNYERRQKIFSIFPFLEKPNRSDENVKIYKCLHFNYDLSSLLNHLLLQFPKRLQLNNAYVL